MRILPFPRRLPSALFLAGAAALTGCTITFPGPGQAPGTDVGALSAYGFDEAYDLLGGGNPDEGSTRDPGVAAHAEAWLDAHAGDTTPWLCVVSLVNPHDMMFCPRFYRLADVEDHGATVPANFESDLSEKPAVQSVWRAENEVVGGIMPDDVATPAAAAQWRQWGNWYLELLRRTDVLMQQVLAALAATPAAGTTVVVRIADHGELGGAHGLRQKGAMIYQENLRVPLVVSDPRRPATHGAVSAALTSHIDVLPTLAALAGLDPDALPELPGHDLTPLLDRPGAQVRDALLVTSDAPSSGLAVPGLRYCLRGAITPRFSYARYSTAAGIDGPPSGFTLECYDRIADPGEVHNLGFTPARNGNGSTLATLDAVVDRLVRQELQPR